MSYIKRLKLKNFKSFANPTVINFEKEFNTVVGANGSGKSNVFDALCFVLGRMSSKGLRADKLGNLVFNGGKNLKKAKDAEVSIYLSNNEKEILNIDLDEIKISRIVKSTGQSKYFLNNQVVTRTQIVEILKRANIDPDGYNIILQGDIMRIVNMSSVERRELIEEISNISGYEEQRQKSLKKLEKLEIELKEADLLMEEKTKYIKELKGEKEQAVKYHKVKDDLRFNSLLLVKAKIIRNSNLLNKKKEDLENNESKLDEFKEKLDEFETKSKEIDNQITSIEKEIEVKSHNDFIEVTNKITKFEHEILNKKEKKAEYTKQISEIKSKLESLKLEIINNKKKFIELQEKLKILNKEKISIEKEILVSENKLTNLKKGMSSKSFEKIDELDLKIEELQEKKINKNHIFQDNSIQIEKLNNKTEYLENDLKKIESSNSENKEQFNNLNLFRSKLKKLIIEISTKTNNNSEISSKLANLQNEYLELTQDYSKLKMKAESSKDLMATNKAVDTITKLATKDSEIHGSVSSLASVPEKYSHALETASGKALFNIVVETDQTAIKYINYLKEHRIGNATFLPLNKIHAKYRLDDSVLNKKGVVDYALNLVNFDRRYEHIFHLIFGNTLVIDRIENAKYIGIGDFRMVTLEGDIVAKSGAMSGGFKFRKKGLGAFKDDKIFERLTNLELKVSQVKGSCDLLREEKEDLEREVYDLRTSKQEIEGEVSKLEKLLSIDGGDTNTIKSQINEIIADKVIIASSLKKIKSDIKLIDDEILEVNSQKQILKANSSGSSNLMESISKEEEIRDKFKNKLFEINSSIDNFNIQINNVLKPELLSLEKIVIDSKSSLENLYNLDKKLKEIILNISTQLKENKILEKELSKDYKQFIEKRDKLKEDKLKLEAKYDKEFTKYDKIKEKSSGLRYTISEYETLNKTLNDELEIQYSFIKSEFVSLDESGDEIGNEKVLELIEEIDYKLKNTTIDVKELQNRVNNLKSRLNAFGSINMKAVEIYDKLKEEFDSLLEKREILNSDKFEILEFISQMDEKKTIRFLKTFKELRENFIKTFAKLSTKGDAELNLENEKDIFNSGVEIKIRLSKTNYLDTKSLSGGEKTITAVAFIFAIQKFNPASFYIFDEIDAALDILNCENLGKLIKSSAHKAQYIVVSHSEHFIQSADTIYGVTMDNNKISGVVSLDLRNAAEFVDVDETNLI